MANGGNFGFDPTKSWARVSLSDRRDTSNYLDVLLNPTSFKLAYKVIIGKLHPVGCSQPTKQYGHTEEVSTTLELYLTAQTVWRRKPANVQPGLEIAYYVDWISQFGMPQAPGIAPKVMLLVWPNVAAMSFVMDSFEIDYTRFDRDLVPREAKINIAIGEIRTVFKTAAAQAGMGWRSYDQGLPADVGGDTSDTGPNLNLGYEPWNE